MKRVLLTLVLSGVLSAFLGCGSKQSQAPSSFTPQPTDKAKTIQPPKTVQP